jgi:benzoate/toluate 1,2-dioxygenase beta subunit/anthranilate 1,2-dioxygenase (deaminating, decarboxylating) small subunit
MKLRLAGQDVLELIHLENALLDERRWDEWLELFTTDCEYWVPMWESEDTLNTDPTRQLSHIYYSSRAGLEDRIARIRSGQSPASSPTARTTHVIGGILEFDRIGGSRNARSSWSCHVFFPMTRKDYVLHGHSRYEIIGNTGTLKIGKKHVQLLNDYIPTMLDIYCV